MASKETNTTIENGRLVVKYDGYKKGSSYYYDPKSGCWFGYEGRDANIKVHLMLGATLSSIAKSDGHYIPVYAQVRDTVKPKRVSTPKKPKNFIPLF